jgi:hypothetical protein
MQPEPPSAVLADTTSPHWKVRAQAGHDLAAWADRDDIAVILHDLVLDPDDTAVTDRTCHALLHRNDVDGLRIVARALTAVLGIDYSHSQHIYDAVLGHHLGPATPDTVRQFVEVCTALTHDTDPATRTGARELLEWAQPTLAALE